MGTRADFYIGRGRNAEWIGSIAWDGHPFSIDDAVLKAGTADEYREAVSAFFNPRDDVTLPSEGWPWPWNDSRTTDYAYAFDDGTVFASSFGHEWFDPKEEEPEDDAPKSAIFPDMSAQQNVAFDGRSGTIILSAS